MQQGAAVDFLDVELFADIDPQKFEYQARSIQNSTVHQITKQYFETFREQIQTMGSFQGLPYFVEKEFESFLSCGSLSEGFVRVKCTDCSDEKLIPFSCKKRGICSSCAGRRMAEKAAHLVDNVIGILPVRQYVLTLPFALRYLLAWNHELTKSVLDIFIRKLIAFYRNRTRKMGLPTGQTGAVTAIQRAGGSINLNIHFHTIAIDGVFVPKKSGVDFYPFAEPTSQEIASLLDKIQRAICKFLMKQDAVTENLAPLNEEYPILAGLYAASTGNQQAFKQGHSIQKLGSAASNHPSAVPQRRCHARINSFDLHAATAVPPNDKNGLEHLLRYILRPLIPGERLSILDNGNVQLKLRTPWSDGTSHLLFEPLEFLGKLAAIIPKPQVNTIIYHGVLAPNAKLRKAVVAYACGKTETGPSSTDDKTQKTSKPPRKYYSFVELLLRVFQIDITKCSYYRKDYL
jgi:ribosomal protein S27E